jgi:hypothetical protein
MDDRQKVDLLLHELIDEEAQILMLMIDNQKSLNSYSQKVEKFDLFLEKSLDR